MPLVEIRDLVRQYHKGGETITPLGGVSLDIQAGDFVSLMGASGSGKSTLLNLLAGIDSPDEGTIHVAGVEITSLSRSRLARWRAEHIGYIFQDHNLVPVLTAWENVELPLLLVKMSRTERQRRVDIAMQAVDLADRAGHFPRQLSGGQEQRVGIARAIVAHPTLVVADAVVVAAGAVGGGALVVEVAAAGAGTSTVSDAEQATPRHTTRHRAVGSSRPYMFRQFPWVEVSDSRGRPTSAPRAVPGRR